VEGQPAAVVTSGRPATRAAGLGRAGLAVARRPRLWPAAARQVRAMVPARWWRRAPFLPVPDRAWLRFRMTTAYGDPDAGIDVDDLLTWLAWTETTRPAPDPHRRPSRP
jgi:hypothetical protein